MSLSNDPFVLLNATIASVLGTRTPIIYYPSYGPSVGTGFAIEAVIDNPQDLEADLHGVMITAWLDGNNVLIAYTPVPGDKLQLADGTAYTVNLVNRDAENGILLLCKRISVNAPSF